MRDAARGAARRRRADDVGADVPRRVRPDPAPRGAAARLPVDFTIYDQADQVRVVKECLEELDHDRSGSPPGASTRRSRTRRTRSSRPRSTASAVASFYDQTVARGLRALPGAPARGERDRLRRPARCAPSTLLERLPGGARRAGRRRSATSSSTSTRTRTARSTGCCSCSPASTRTSASSATPTSRSTRCAAPTSATSSSSSTTSRARRSSRSSRTTARRTRILEAANAVIVEQPRAQAEGALERARRGRAGPHRRGRGRARRGAPVVAEIARLVEEGYAGARSRSSTGRTRSRACSRTSCAARHPLPGRSAGRASSSAPRSRTSLAYLRLIDNPPTRSPSADRRTSARAASATRRSTRLRTLRRRAGHLALGGVRRGRSKAGPRPARRPGAWPGSGR